MTETGRKRNNRRQDRNRPVRSLKEGGSGKRAVLAEGRRKSVRSAGVSCQTAFYVGVDGPFDSPKSKPLPPKLYRIGEVVDYSGLSRQTIHNYTTMGLLRESTWTQGGHRLYDETAFYRLNEIAEFKAQRKSMRFIREYYSRMDNG